MKIAFLNLCHCEPVIVGRVAKKLTENPNFDMYIHVDDKQDIEPFKKAVEGTDRVYFTKNRYKVYWGGFNAIHATMELLSNALESNRNYDYVVTLQNLDYPIKSNAFIEEFFEKNKGKEFIRGCNIAGTKDWHFAEKYKIYNKRDDDFYLRSHNKVVKFLHDGVNAVKSISTIGSRGTIKSNGKKLDIYYGTAQWAVTRECAEYILEFYRTNEKFNRRMEHIKFPDEEYPHTVVHNSKYKEKCIKYNEPEKRWLVNWRNIHYFEFPKQVTVFDETAYERIMEQPDLFVRKVKSGVSDRLMDMIDEATK